MKRLSHNSKSQQKEVREGRYIEKPASDFAKYLIMGQTLNCAESMQFHRLILKRHTTANNPMIENTALNPGMPMSSLKMFSPLSIKLLEWTSLSLEAAK